MGKHLGLSPGDVRRAYLRAGADCKATAKALGVTDSTVRYHLSKIAPPLTVPKVNLPGLDPADPDALAIGDYVRLCLERAGITR